LRLGEDVPGILTDHWKFVAEDPGDYVSKVKRYDSEARLVIHVGTGQLGVARYVKASFAPEGAWMIAFRVRDPETGEPLTGDPDERVLTLMRKFDTWARSNPGRLAKAAKETLRRREDFLSDEVKARNNENALKFIHDYKKESGQRGRVFVPAGAGGAE
jgi:hypothetical protein